MVNLPQVDPNKADFADARRLEATALVEGLEGVTKVINIEKIASVETS